jgi:hypothetical protein
MVGQLEGGEIGRFQEALVQADYDRLGLGQSVIFTPNGQQHDIGVMGLTLTKPVDND